MTESSNDSTAAKPKRKPTTRPRKPKTYTAAPVVPEEAQARYRAVLAVLSGQMTVSAAARELDMSRNHFQTILHRGLEGLLAAITPGKAGRPAKPPREEELETQRDALLRKSASLARRLDMTTRLMALATEVMKGSTSRSRSKRSTTAATKETPDESDDPITELELARQVSEMSLPRALVARAFGIPEATLRQHATPSRRPRRKRSVLPAPETVAAAVAEVRELRGLLGAESLTRSYPELSRRQAASIKHATMTNMERERRAACRRVTITTPGVVRGFDQLDFGQRCAPRYALISADAAIPYRTSIAVTPRYDTAAVADALTRDFERNGAPLVLRLDRAACHDAPEVQKVLARFGVLPLHGPPRYPRFYGQTERQNRDHRAWLDADLRHGNERLDVRLQRMTSALNDRWRRRQLAWRTPAEVWATRPPLVVDRPALHREVAARAADLLRSPRQDTLSEDLANRLAVQQALANLGYLRIETGRRLLGNNQP